MSSCTKSPSKLFRQITVDKKQTRITPHVFFVRYDKFFFFDVVDIGFIPAAAAPDEQFGQLGDTNVAFDGEEEEEEAEDISFVERCIVNITTT